MTSQGRYNHYHHHRRPVVGNSPINIRMANLTEFPYTIKSHTKIAELLKAEDTKQIRLIDIAALSLLQDPDDAHKNHSGI